MELTLKTPQMGELIHSWNVDAVLRRREPAHRMNQVNLFKSIAAFAAVITCCIGNPLPAKAGMQQFTVIGSNNGVYPDINAFTGNQAKQMIQEPHGCCGMKVARESAKSLRRDS